MNDKPRCPTTLDWDKYIIGVEVEESKRLTQHLELCGFCRLAFGERQRILTSLSDAWLAATKHSVMYLAPLLVAGETAAENISLAAQSGSRDEGNEGVTLATPQKEMLLKVLRDHHTHEIWLYLLADQPSLYDHVIVKPFDIDREYVTDAKGKINLGKIDWPKADVLRAEVRFPEAIFELLPMAGDTSDCPATILTTPRGDEIRVMLTGEKGIHRLDIEVTKLSTVLADTPLKIAIRETGGGSSLHVRTIVSAKAKFDDVKSADKIEIYLFQ